MSILRASLRMLAALISFSLFTVSFQPQTPAPAPSVTPAQNQAPVLVTKFIGILDSKSAKVGEPVAAKVVREFRLNDIDIPKGAKLTGTVSSVQSKKNGDGNSSLSIKFDRVELKKGAILRVAGLIVAIGPVANSSGIGFDSVLARGGGGFGSGLNQDAIAGKHEDDIRDGSSLEGVALGMHLDAAGASDLRGVHREIRIDSDTMLKVALYRGAS
jgi:hypothetical protein